MMKRVLVVDDERIVRHAVRLALESSYEIEEAVSGPDALEKVRINPPDAFILDIRMPKMDGRQLALRLSLAGFDKAPILFITGHDTDTHHYETVPYNFCGLLSKPFEFSELRRLLADSLAKL